jgi:uncharacterized protein YkvS
MEKIETEFEANNGAIIECKVTLDDIIEKVNEIVEWINDHKDQQLSS